MRSVNASYVAVLLVGVFVLGAILGGFVVKTIFTNLTQSASEPALPADHVVIKYPFLQVIVYLQPDYQV